MQTYRPRSAYVWGWISVAFGGLVAIAQLATTGWADAHVGFGLGLALIGAGIAVFLRPSVQVGAEGVTVRNITQVISVPYSRLAVIESQWSLEFVGDDGRKVGVMAAPARSRRDRHRPHDASTPPLAEAIQTHRDAWRASGPGGDASGEDENLGPHEASAGSTGPDGAGPAFARRVDWVGVLWVALALGGAAGAFFL